jgi:hypothetical protein
MFPRVIEATFVLIMAYLIILNGDKFSIAVKAAGEVYTNAVKTLQGR